MCAVNDVTIAQLVNISCLQAGQDCQSVTHVTFTLFDLDLLVLFHT